MEEEGVLEEVLESTEGLVSLELVRYGFSGPSEKAGF